MKTTKAATVAAEIAQARLGIETLETQNSDSADFHDLAVWNIKAALEAAYETGRRDAMRASSAHMAAVRPA
jgi:hypothetical protein